MIDPESWRRNRCLRCKHAALPGQIAQHEFTFCTGCGALLPYEAFSSGGAQCWAPPEGGRGLNSGL